MPVDVLSGFLIGLSSGISCAGVCSPYLVPFLLSENRDIKQNFFIILEFLIGRLIAYLLMGLFSGFIGVTLNELIISPKIIGAVMFITGIMLFLYSIGITNIIKIHFIQNIFIRIPFGAGLVSGLNICPPFITAFTYAVSFKNIIISIIYFLFFFTGTSVYLIPFIFSGFISKYETARNVGKISGVLVGLFVVVRAILFFINE
ncbi:MAG: sulfite exporter TauE/SafE family protein [Candidatus Goldbacteria bacterium]|nr:sulfite exporter TauE/SafE family protein [Candidatus Goldiibacteriota bacterium]